MKIVLVSFKKCRLIINTMLVVFLSALTANAQVNSPADNLILDQAGIENNLRIVVKSSLDEVLAQYLKKETYFYSINLEVNSSALSEDLPYLPGGQNQTQITSVSDANYKKFLKKLEIELYFSADINELTRNQLKKLITKKLSLNETQGDVISLFDLEITIPQEKTDESKKLEAQLLKTENLLEEAKNKLNNSNEDMREIKRKIETLETDKNKLKDELLKAQSLSKNITETKKQLDLEFWVEKGVIVAAIIIAMILLMLISKTISSSIRAVGDGIKAIGNGLQGIAGSIGQSQGKETEKLREEKPVKTEAPVTMKSEAINAKKSDAGIKDIRDRLASLSEELKRDITDLNERFVLDYLVKQLKTPETVGNAVMAMELLGSKKANEFYRKLPIEAKDEVLIFLDRGHFLNNKYDLMLSAGEDLKTYLLKEGFGTKKGANNRSINEYLIAMSDSDLAKICLSLDSEQISRLFLYLDPAKSATLLNLIYKLNTEKGVSILDIIPKIPLYTERFDLDESIVSKMTEFKEKQDNDVQRPFIKYYHNIINALDADLSEVALNRFADADQMVGHYLKQNIITFSTFFVLKKELQSDIVASLSNKEISSLIFSSPDESKMVISNLVPERRQEFLKEEIESLTSLPETRAKQLYKDVKIKVVGKINMLKQNGQLDLHAEHADEELPINNEAAA